MLRDEAAAINIQDEHLSFYIACKGWWLMAAQCNSKIAVVMNSIGVDTIHALGHAEFKLKKSLVAKHD